MGKEGIPACGLLGHLDRSGRSSYDFHTTMSTDFEHQQKNGTDQLNLVLSFFPRVDSKLSVVFAINTGILAVLAADAPALRAFTVSMTVATSVTIVLLALSIVFWYRGAFPHLKGGQASLVYFREIAGRTEHGFIEAFRSQTEEQRLNDVLAQVWRNSEILKKKFDALKVAFVLTAVALVPWIVSLVLFAGRNSQNGTLLFK